MAVSQCSHKASQRAPSRTQTVSSRVPVRAATASMPSRAVLDASRTSATASQGSTSSTAAIRGRGTGWRANRISPAGRMAEGATVAAYSALPRCQRSTASALPGAMGDGTSSSGAALAPGRSGTAWRWNSAARRTGPAGGYTTRSSSSTAGASPAGCAVPSAGAAQRSRHRSRRPGSMPAAQASAMKCSSAEGSRNASDRRKPMRTPACSLPALPPSDTIRPEASRPAQPSSGSRRTPPAVCSFTSVHSRWSLLSPATAVAAM